MRKTILILLASLLLTGCAADPVSTTESTAATTCSFLELYCYRRLLYNE